jgi:hypothetical protein
MDSRNAQQRTRGMERERSELATVLAVSGWIAMVFAYLLVFSVLGDSGYASKFENGYLPAGFDATSGQTAAAVSLGAAVFAVVATIAAATIRSSRLVSGLAVLGLLAAMPYAGLELITWQLAF